MTEKTHVAEEQNRRAKKPLVWVIDDNIEKQEALNAKLAFAGYEVFGFKSHRLAADHLGDASELPAAIFCDYETESSYSADWFMDELKASGWLDKTKVIAISGSNRLNEKLTGLGAQAKIESDTLMKALFSDSMASGSVLLRSYVGERVARLC